MSHSRYVIYTSDWHTQQLQVIIKRQLRNGSYHSARYMVQNGTPTYFRLCALLFARPHTYERGACVYPFV